jgi:hypothetical protein
MSALKIIEGMFSVMDEGEVIAIGQAAADFLNRTQDHIDFKFESVNKVNLLNKTKKPKRRSDFGNSVMPDMWFGVIEKVHNPAKQKTLSMKAVCNFKFARYENFKELPTGSLVIIGHKHGNEKQLAIGRIDPSESVNLDDDVYRDNGMFAGVKSVRVLDGVQILTFQAGAGEFQDIRPGNRNTFSNGYMKGDLEEKGYSLKFIDGGPSVGFCYSILTLGIGS